MFNDLRKDQIPKVTINNIKKILKNNNIKVKQYKFKNIYKDFYSIRIEIKGFYNLGSNGKGLSLNAAKASAYAELMERLQSKMLINSYYLGKIYNDISFEDEEAFSYNDFKNNNTLPLNLFFDNRINSLSFLKKCNKYRIMSDFININTSKKEKLPIKLINTTTHSNGLCAGNSFNEALTQGICEILERFCYKTILEKEIALTDIIIDNKLNIYNKIKNLEKKGYTIKIKDCSLNKFPVIGVLIFKKNKYLFTLASDPNINIAIQRCFTELFQGLNSIDQIYKKMKPFNNDYDNLTIEEKKANWLKCYSSNNGFHPKRIFKTNKSIKYSELTVFKKIDNNKDSYNYLIQILKNNNYTIYIKDYSYMNFNTYKVYIPKLSEIDKIEYDELDFLYNYNLINKIFFNIKSQYSNEELKSAITCIKKILKIEKYKFMSVGNLFHSNYYLNTNYNLISTELLYILLNYKISNNLTFNINKINNKSLKKYIENIELKNEKNKFEYILNDLNLKLPNCPNCDKCKLKFKCKYKHWNKLNNKLNCIKAKKN